MDSFRELLWKIRGVERAKGLMMSFDPGETCGWAFFEYGSLGACGQEKIDTSTGHVLAKGLWDLVETYQPEAIVIEDYRIYANKTEMHTWSALYTPKLIGYIEAICERFEIPYTLQLASSKQFCTDEKLKQWGYYEVGQQHARDAIRHGCYWLLFNGRKTNVG